MRGAGSDDAGTIIELVVRLAWCRRWMRLVTLLLATGPMRQTLRIL
jgi:hypothetical protein